jgi:predicted nucleotidyltransferase
MKARSAYPGTPQHQVLLRTVVSHYEGDPRVLAVVVFGSLGRGTWDAYSDLDLDVVIADGVVPNPVYELRRLCDAFVAVGEKAALVIPDGDDAGDVLFESRMRLSVRYHRLSATSPNIVDSMLVLVGRVEPATIESAGLANRSAPAGPLSQLLDRCVWYAADTSVALQRGQVWAAVEVLHRMRGIVMELFARTRNGGRGYRVFEAEADARLQARLGAALPQGTLVSLQASLVQLLDILDKDLDHVTNGQVRLTEAHRRVLDRIRSNHPFNPLPKSDDSL